ncbi:armadillo-type protein [Cladochytrium replicatum]|nr:armadillo-type protein [Cladochytrium replicatum]
MTSDPFAFAEEDLSLVTPRKRVRQKDAPSAHPSPFPSRKMANTGRQTLKFNLPLTAGGRGDGKSLTSSEIARRLKVLQEELGHLEQESVDTSSLARIRTELLTPSLLEHKDRSIKMLVACCIADLLRLYAPDAPYVEQELKKIFEFFIEQLKMLSRTEEVYYPHCFYLLESLSTVRSVLLVTDLSNSEELISRTFHTFFQVIRPDHSKNVYMCIHDILHQLIEEAPILSQEVVETILAYFRDKKPDENDAANQLAVDLCRNASDKLQRYVCQYFSDLILSTNRSVDPDDLDEDEEDRLGISKQAHRQILEIYRVAPAVLLNVIPQLEEEMKVEDDEIRVIATSTLGIMFSQPGSYLAATYPAVWKAWLERRNDKSVNIRLVIPKFAPDILKNHAELSNDMCAALTQKLLDPEEKVRVAVVKAIGSLDVVSVSNVSKSVLEATAHRCRDKKGSVRSEAVKTLSAQYSMVYPELAKGGDGQMLEKFGWIPAAILELMYVNDKEVNVLVERALHENLLPPIQDDAARTDRLLFILAGLDNDRLKKAFKAILLRQSEMIQLMNQFIAQCERYNGGIMDDPSDIQKTKKILDVVIRTIADRFPDPIKADEHLQKFASANERRLYQLLRSLLNPGAEYKQILKSSREIMKKVQSSIPSIAETVAALLRRVSFTVVNTCCIPRIIEHLRDLKSGNNSGDASGERDLSQPVAQLRSSDDHMQNEKLGLAAESLIKDIAELLPELLSKHTEHFMRILSEDVNNILVSDAISTLALFIRSCPERAPPNLEGISRLKELAIHGTVDEARNSVTVIAHVSDSAEHLEEITVKIVAVLDLDNNNSPTHMASLAQIAYYSPDTFQLHNVKIVNFIVKDVIMGDSIDDPHDSAEWVDFNQLHVHGVTKVLALKVLIKRLLSPHLSPQSRSDGITPVLKLLIRLLENDGRPTTDSSTCPAFASHLRLVAAKSLLRLIGSTPPGESNTKGPLLDPHQSLKLALTIQDPIFEVRNQFVEKLLKYLLRRKMSMNFLSMLALAAHDPETTFKAKVKSFLTKQGEIQRAGSQENAAVESLLPRVIHLLSLHPDFSTEPEALTLLAGYLEFFVDAVATSESVSYMYHLAGKIKLAKDKHSDTENIYVLSDMCQLIIRDKCRSAGWTLNAYPDDAKLPSELYEKLSPSDAQENVKRNYLPDSYTSSRTVGASMRNAKTPRRRSRKSITTPRAKQTPSKKTPSRKRRKLSEQMSSEDETASASESEEENDEGENLVAGAESREESSRESLKGGNIQTPKAPKSGKRPRKEGGRSAAATSKRDAPARASKSVAKRNLAENTSSEQESE